MMCDRCAADFADLARVQRYFNDLRAGKFTWGHAEKAHQHLKELADATPPRMQVKFCERCAANKRQRVS